MPWTVAVPAIASVVGGGLNFLGQENASSNQNNQSQAALEFAKEQAAQQQQNYEQQQAALKAQWDARQAALAPINAARLGMLRYYGFNPGPSAAPAPFPGEAAPVTAPNPQTGNLASILGMTQSPGFHPYVGPTSNPAMSQGLGPAIPQIPTGNLPSASIADLMGGPQ